MPRSWITLTVRGVVWLSGLFIIAAWVVLTGTILLQGVPALLDLPVLVTLGRVIAITILLPLISLGLVLPLGLAAGVYLAEFAGNDSLTLIRGSLGALAVTPSVLLGLLAILILVRGLDLGFSPISAVLGLAVLNLPTVIQATEDALREVPCSMREASLGVGATVWQTYYRVVFPYALPTLAKRIGSVFLRGFGEVTLLIMTLGWPANGAETLPVLLWQEMVAGSPVQAISAAAVLLFAMTLIFMLPSLAGRKTW